MRGANEQVAEFHRTFGLPVRDEFTEINSEELDFRLRLITEEYIELMEAYGRPVIVKAIPHRPDTEPVPDFVNGYKELADLKYVIEGFDLHLGRRLGSVFDEVHRSNMSKTWVCGCGHWDEEHTYHHDPGCSTCGGSGTYVSRREDGKVLKPDTYSVANISSILESE